MLQRGNNSPIPSLGPWEARSDRVARTGCTRLGMLAILSLAAFTCTTGFNGKSDYVNATQSAPIGGSGGLTIGTQVSFPRLPYDGHLPLLEERASTPNVS